MSPRARLISWCRWFSFYRRPYAKAQITNSWFVLRRSNVRFSSLDVFFRFALSLCLHIILFLVRWFVISFRCCCCCGCCCVFNLCVHINIFISNVRERSCANFFDLLFPILFCSLWIRLKNFICCTSRCRIIMHFIWSRYVYRSHEV